MMEESYREYEILLSSVHFLHIIALLQLHFYIPSVY